MSEDHRAFPTLDAVRALGATLVLLTHCAFNTGRINQGWTGAALSRFDIGVALFFIVSGFLLALPWLSGPQPLGGYLLKRALRILPLYWVVVVVAMVVDPVNHTAGVTDWLRQLTLTQIYVPGGLASSLTQMWSLCTEVAFYLVLPFLARLLSGRTLSLRRVLLGCAVLSAAGLAWAAYSRPLLGSYAGQWLPGYLPWFLIGVAFAACRLDPAARARLDRWASDLTGWWLLAVAVFAIACSDIAGPRLLLPPTAWEGFLKCLLYGVAGGCLLLPLVFGPPLEGRVRRVLASPVPAWLGRISYGIFAIHMLVLIQGMRLFGIDDFTGHFVPVTLGTAVVSVTLAALSFRYLETPVMRLRNRLPAAASRPASGPVDAPAESRPAESRHRA